ncbi:MAG TPA: hydroxyacid dehydrogenase [Chthonomonadaceae bacterium]|nr:hydroxyacid dehydrogenase [Chthonomonadaceae bacterium]
MPGPKIGVVIHTTLRDQIFTPADIERLNALGDVRYTDAPTPLTVEAACHLLQDCEVGLGSWRTPYPNAELVTACQHLRLWEHAAGTVKHFFGPHLEGRDLTVASCKTAIADSVAELTLGEIILGLRQILPNAAANRLGAAPAPANHKGLFAATVGVLGASEVGKRVLRLLQPFGCRILLYDPTLTPEQAVALGATLVPDVLELCRNSDAITLHTPNIPACYHLLDAEAFAAMPDDAVFINTARGDCIDEAALIAELEKGRLFAFLDVTSPEPTAPNSPLRRLPNVVLNSHIAGLAAANIGKQAVDDIAAFLRGERPLCVVTADQLDYTA